MQLTLYAEKEQIPVRGCRCVDSFLLTWLLQPTKSQQDFREQIV